MKKCTLKKELLISLYVLISRLKGDGNSSAADEAAAVPMLFPQG